MHLSHSAMEEHAGKRFDLADQRLERMEERISKRFDRLEGLPVLPMAKHPPAGKPHKAQ